MAPAISTDKLVLLLGSSSRQSSSSSRQYNESPQVISQPFSHFLPSRCIGDVRAYIVEETLKYLAATIPI
jgi:hypothetical protein